MITTDIPLTTTEPTYRTPRGLAPMPFKPRVLEVGGVRLPLTLREVSVLRHGLEALINKHSDGSTIDQGEGRPPLKNVRSIASALLHALLIDGTIREPANVAEWRHKHDPLNR